MKSRFLRRLLAVFFPERCHFCGAVIKPETEFCENCREQEERLRICPPVCPLCGRQKTANCCQKHRRMFERSVSVYTYEDAAKRGIVRFKTLPTALDAAFYAEKMARIVRREYADERLDGVIPVPMSLRQIKQRAENPTLQLAKALSAQLSIPLLDVLIKIYDTRSQKELAWRERQGNLLGVFDIKESFSPKGGRYLLVDDVITSGATLHECAKMLKIYGAEQVMAVTIAASRLDDKTKR